MDNQSYYNFLIAVVAVLVLVIAAVVAYWWRSRGAPGGSSDDIRLSVSGLSVATGGTVTLTGTTCGHHRGAAAPEPAPPAGPPPTGWDGWDGPPPTSWGGLQPMPILPPPWHPGRPYPPIDRGLPRGGEVVRIKRSM